MRISDNPAITQSTMGAEAGSDVMLLTDVNDLTSGGVPKDKRITLANLATWMLYRYTRQWGTTEQAMVNGGDVTFFSIAGTRYVSNASIDFNNYTSPGKYYITRPSQFTAWDNAPPGAINGWLEVYHNAQTVEANAVVKQIFHRQGGQPNSFKYEYFRIRSAVGGSYVWSQWLKYSTGFTYIAPKSNTAAMSVSGLSNTTVLNTGELSQGVYLLVGGAQYGLGSTETYTAIGFSESNNGDLINESQIAVATKNATHLQCSYIVEITAAKTLYLNAYHNGSSAINVSNRYISIVKLGDSLNE